MIFPLCGRDSSVETGYGLGGPGVESRGGVFHPVQTSSEANPASSTLGARFFLGITRPECSADYPHPPPSLCLHMHVMGWLSPANCLSNTKFCDTLIRYFGSRILDSCRSVDEFSKRLVRYGLSNIINTRDVSSGHLIFQQVCTFTHFVCTAFRKFKYLKMR